jgi:cation diffusion facilitator CzcD-associated flavoprotein CzcO
MSERIEDLPVAVIGGGPVGLAAAAQLIARGLPMRVYEAGETVATNVRSWGHVRLFSFWRYNMDEVAKGLLREHGWQEPQEDGLPTGNELCDAYLEPLAEIPAIGGAIETKTRVRAITRQGIDKVTSRNRAKHPFAPMVENQKGARIDLARAVIDASGTWQNQNPLGAAGIPATGEAGQGAIVYGIPDILGSARADYASARCARTSGQRKRPRAVIYRGAFEIANM